MLSYEIGSSVFLPQLNVPSIISPKLRQNERRKNKMLYCSEGLHRTVFNNILLRSMIVIATAQTINRVLTSEDQVRVHVEICNQTGTRTYFLREGYMDLSFQSLSHKISVALVRTRTIPTERPPLVGEVSANFCGQRGVTWSAQRVPTAVNLCFLDLEPLLFFIQVAPQLTSRG